MTTVTFDTNVVEKLMQLRASLAGSQESTTVAERGAATNGRPTRPNSTTAAAAMAKMVGAPVRQPQATPAAVRQPEPAPRAPRLAPVGMTFVARAMKVKADPSVFAGYANPHSPWADELNRLLAYYRGEHVQEYAERMVRARELDELIADQEADEADTSSTYPADDVDMAMAELGWLVRDRQRELPDIDAPTWYYRVGDQLSGYHLI